MSSTAIGATGGEGLARARARRTRMARLSISICKSGVEFPDVADDDALPADRFNVALQDRWLCTA